MVGAAKDAFGGNQMEVVEHKNVGEIGETQNGILGEPRAIQLDDGYEAPQKSSLASVRGECTPPMGASVIGATAPS